MKWTVSKIGTLCAAAFAALLGLAAAYLLLLCFPQPLFAYHYASGQFTIYDDSPLEPSACGKLLADAGRRLHTCPLNQDLPHQNVFLCNSEWQHRLLMALVPKAGGVAYGPIHWNIFLRRCSVSENVLFTRQGSSSGADRPLSYFIAHEITHNLTERRLGPFAYFRLPVWEREGYADYVGKGGDFNFKKNLALFKKNDPSLNPRASGLYLRYQLMVAYLLDRQGLSAEAMLTRSFDASALEQTLQGLSL